MTSKQLTTSNSTDLQAYDPEIIQDAIEKIMMLSSTGKLTLETAFEDRQISYYRKESGSEMLGKIISTWLLALATSFKIDPAKNFNGNDASESAQIILNQYWFLRLAEIKLFCEGARLGKYGKVFDRFDIQTLFVWLDKYIEMEREPQVERNRTTRQKQNELPAEISAYNPDVAKMIRETIHELQKPIAAKIAATNVPLSDEVRDEKQRCARLARLFEWFPKEMDYVISIIEVKLHRFKKPTSTAELLANRKIKKLESIINEKTKKTA